MKKTLYTLLAAVAVISCTKAQTTVSPEQEILQPKGQLVSFKIVATKDSETKATLSASDKCIYWDNGDAESAKLFNAAFASEGGVTPSSFEISGDRKSVTITYTDVELKQGYQTASDTFWFVFGAEGSIKNGGYESESIDYVLPTIVSGAKAQPVMVGVCETTDHNSLSFNLQLAAAYAKIGIKPDEPSASLSKAEIFGADATTYIAGTCNFAKNGTITPVSSGSTDYCHISATNLGGAKEFYVNLNPRNNSTTTTDLTLILFNPSGQAMMRDLNSTTLAKTIHLTPSSYHEFIYGSFKPITITSTISATTTYSQYTAGQVTLANNTANTYKIWGITANKTVTGIPASSSRLENFILPKYFCDGAELDGNVAEKQEVKAHTISVNFIFDYLNQSILLASNVASTTAYITGLPYSAVPPTQNNGWTADQGSSKVDWKSGYVSLGDGGTATADPRVKSPDFYSPVADLAVNINTEGTIYTTKVLVSYPCTCTLRLNGNKVKETTSTSTSGNALGTNLDATVKLPIGTNNVMYSINGRTALSGYVRISSVEVTYQQ